MNTQDSISADNILRIKIYNTDIFIEELGENKGKITISDTYNHNYSCFWGSMGGTLKEFMLSINAGYFADKLLGTRSCYEMDVAKTFAGLRKFITNELGLQWYMHKEFQKDMREVLKSFQRDCENEPSADFFVRNFDSYFIKRLDFYFVKDRYESERLKKEFEGLSEVWNFIQEKPSKEYLWLVKLHSKLRKELKGIA